MPSHDDVIRIISSSEARNLWRHSMRSSVEDVNDALSEIQDKIITEAERGFTDVRIKNYKSIIPNRQVRKYVELILKDMEYDVSRDEDDTLDIEWDK